jgi:hypothetical protein
MLDSFSTPTAKALHSAHVVPRTPLCAFSSTSFFCDPFSDYSERLQNAADASVVAVLKANLPPAAFAVLEEFRKDFDKACDGVGNTPLLLALEHLSEPDTQKVLGKTLRRLQRNA